MKMSFRILYSIVVCFLVFATGKCEDVSGVISSEYRPYRWYKNLPAVRGRIYSRVAEGACNQPGETLPDLTDCTAFWVCEDLSSPVQYSCPNGQFFNANINRCDDNSTVCGPNLCTAQGEKHPDKYDCASYYLCDSALNAIMIPCGEGQFYDEGIENCRTNTDVECNGRPGCFYGGQTFPDVEDCHGFYVCNKALKPVHYYCLNNGYFDDASYKCSATGGPCT